jgi:hypothetical protein
MAIHTGNFLDELANSLGYTNEQRPNICRIVIDASVNRLAKIYIEERLDGAVATTILDLVKRSRELRPNHVITLDEHGNPGAEESPFIKVGAPSPNDPPVERDENGAIILDRYMAPATAGVFTKAGCDCPKGSPHPESCPLVQRRILQDGQGNFIEPDVGLGPSDA